MIYVLESERIYMISHLSYAQDSGWGIDFLKGFVIDAPLGKEDLFVEVEKKKISLPDYFEVDGVPVVTQKVIDTFKSAGVDNFQAFPVEVRFEDETVSGYSLLNVIGRVKCFDMEKTDCSKFGPSIARINSLKLVDEPAYGGYMFRAHEYQEIIFITEQVKAAIEESGITGYEIRNADGWSDRHRF